MFSPYRELLTGSGENMEEKLRQLSKRYVTALRNFLKPGVRGSLQPALSLGSLAVSLGLETLELARIHERAVAALKISNGRNSSTRRAEIFFTEAITPIVERHRPARESKIELTRLNQSLKRRTTELAVTHRELQRGIVRRKSVELALKTSGEHYTRLLKESLQLQEGLRQLAHQVMAAQEDERQSISRELQDEIAQDLLGINVRLLSLKKEAKCDPKDFENEIAGAQRLVAESARAVRRVARKFRTA